jgi:hypothetical protein
MLWYIDGVVRAHIFILVVLNWLPTKKHAGKIFFVDFVVIVTTTIWGV